MSTKDHKAHDAFFDAPRSDRCASVVVLVTLHLRTQ